eukprot:17643-Prorocentrum_minimum.AAC.1
MLNRNESENCISHHCAKRVLTNSPVSPTELTCVVGTADRGSGRGVRGSGSGQARGSGQGVRSGGQVRGGRGPPRTHSALVTRPPSDAPSCRLGRRSPAPGRRVPGPSVGSAESAQ